MAKKWIIEPANTKCIVECDIWSNGKYDVRALHGWRWGEIYIECPNKPDISLNNPNGINILKHFENEYSNGKLYYDLDDSNWNELEFPKGMTRKMKDKIQEIWDEYGNLDDNDDDLDGWDIIGTEVWIHGELTIKEKETVSL
jgi:hypothetical protein